MIRWRDLGFLVAGGAAATALVAKVSAEPIIVSAPASAVQAPRPAPAQMGGSASQVGTPALAALQGEAPMTLQRLNDSTMVGVKDHGDSQTVFVFTFDDNGVMKPTPQKMRFYYK